MQNNILKYSALVFAGGASYGVMATTVKSALSDGFSWPQIVATQPLFGSLLFAIALGAVTLWGKKLVALSARQILCLLGLGLSTGTTCILYNFSLSLLPVPLAITLLFQFTWVGIVIQMVATRRLPRVFEVVSVLVILVGTLMASGLFSENLIGFNLLGIVCGVLSAVSTALFMFLSGRIGVGLPSVQRGLFVCLGASILCMLACPTYFTSGALQAGIWKQGIILGGFGLLIPVILFGIGTPHLPTGLSTIMASAELPCGIAVSIVILGESIDPVQTVGVVIILAGVVISQIPHLLLAREVRRVKKKNLYEPYEHWHCEGKADLDCRESPSPIKHKKPAAK